MDKNVAFRVRMVLDQSDGEVTKSHSPLLAAD